MTIQVTIENKDQTRSVEVVRVEIDKKTGQRTEASAWVLKPGFNTTEYVHLLRDLIVREIEPGRG